MNITTISPQELAHRMDSGEPIDVIDVRTPVEFREVHLVNAKNIPLDRLDPHAVQSERNGTASGPLYVICQSGSRGDLACQKFVQAGIANVANVAGGTKACEEAGLPVERGKRAISLERQVRIAAGSFVLVGALLGLFVHPYWSALSAFVGAGLIFAGVTDTCAMGMLLARMPWNHVDTSCQAN